MNWFKEKGREGESQEGDCLLLHSLLKKLGEVESRPVRRRSKVGKDLKELGH